MCHSLNARFSLPTSLTVIGFAENNSTGAEAEHGVRVDDRADRVCYSLAIRTWPLPVRRIVTA